DRRLCGRLQPRAADGALGALFLRSRRARFHEAHVAAQVRRRRARKARPGRDRARPGGRVRGPRPLCGDATGPTMGEPVRRLVKVTLEEESSGRWSREVEHERAVAIYDLLEENSFSPVGHEGGPYALYLSITGNRLVFDVRSADDAPVVAHHLS